MNFRELFVRCLELFQGTLRAVKAVNLALELDLSRAMLQTQVIELFLQVASLIYKLRHLFVHTVDLLSKQVALISELLPHMLLILVLTLQRTHLALLSRKLLRDPLVSLLLYVQKVLELTGFGASAVHLLFEQADLLLHPLLVEQSLLNLLTEHLDLSLQGLVLRSHVLQLLTCLHVGGHLLLELHLQVIASFNLSVQRFLKSFAVPDFVQIFHLSFSSEFQLLLVFFLGRLMLASIHLALVSEPHLILLYSLQLFLQSFAFSVQFLDLRLQVRNLFSELALNSVLLLFVSTFHKVGKSFVTMLVALPCLL
mmetsp:Transcript_23298/g.42115  ORF Transcript_23298/g.42115 Transcript_23298/m.42115 type:complete len:311 (-) Transcript_23298:840-1772(-)